LGYIHINNLYKNQIVLLFKECYALEKLHGTSSHISWNNKEKKISFFSGGAEHLLFRSLFDIDFLKEQFIKRCNHNVTIYGEAYGGKMQNMQATYGDKLRFAAFDVKIEDSWMNVDRACNFVKHFDLDFVPFEKCSTDIEILNAMRDKPSEQAIKCGILVPRQREGIVIRPLIEMKTEDGSRIIAKHRIKEFSETKTERYIDPEKNVVLEKANEIADEWCTEMRLTHVLQHFPQDITINMTPKVIEAMIEDIERESEGEIEKSREARKAISKLTFEMFKNRLNKEVNNG